MIERLLIFLLGAAVSAAACFYIVPHRIEKITIEKPVVIENVKTITETAIQYVPKETITIIERDPITGKETTVQKKENTDVDIKIQQPAVNLKVNDKPYEFTLLQDETQKFEQGKVSMKQTSDINFNVVIKPVDKTKKHSVGIGMLGSERFISAGYTPNNVIEYKLIGNEDNQGGEVEIRF